MKKRHLFWLDFYAKHNYFYRLINCLVKLEDRERERNKDVKLFETKYAATIVAEYAKMYALSETALLKVFELPNAKEILSNYVPEHQLPIPVEFKLFEHPDMKDIVRKYIAKQHISDKAVFKLFELPNAHELLLLYITENNHMRPFGFDSKLVEISDNVELITAFKKREELSVAAQDKMFDRPNAAELVKAYIKDDMPDKLPRPLADSAQFKMLALPQAEELLQEYGYQLCYEAELKLFELPNAESIVRRYIHDFKFQLPKAEAKIFELPNAPDILDEYLADAYLNERNEGLLLNLSDGVNRMIKYMQNVQLSQQTLKKFFTHSASEELLTAAIKTQKFSPELQKRLFTCNNAIALLRHYIERQALCTEAQLLLFKLPQNEAQELLSLYAVKYAFSHEVTQLLMVNNHFGIC